jgi:hypothetical protein
VLLLISSSNINGKNTTLHNNAAADLVFLNTASSTSVASQPKI